MLLLILQFVNVSWIVLLMLAAAQSQGKESISDKLQDTKAVFCHFVPVTQYNLPGLKLSTREFIPCTHITYDYLIVFEGVIQDFIFPDEDQRFIENLKKSTGWKPLILLSIWFKKGVAMGIARDVKRFTETTTAILRRRQLDGLELVTDIQHFGQEEMEDLVNVTRALREHFDWEAKNEFKGDRLLLAVTVKPDKPELYHMDLLNVVCDFVIVKAIVPTWKAKMEPITLQHPSVMKTKDGRQLPQTKLMEVWTKGIWPRKLVMAVPTFGLMFLLKNSTLTNIGDPAAHFVTSSSKGWTDLHGYVPYYSMCSLVNESGMHQHHVDGFLPVATGHQTGASRPVWIGFEDLKSMQEKVQYVFASGILGLKVYSIHLDDFDDVCGQGRLPITSFVMRKLTARSAETETVDTSGSQLPGCTPTLAILKVAAIQYIWR